MRQNDVCHILTPPSELPALGVRHIEGAVEVGHTGRQACSAMGLMEKATERQICAVALDASEGSRYSLS